MMLKCISNRIMKIKAYNAKRQGDYMYNYKFEDSVSDCVVSSFNNAQMQQDIDVFLENLTHFDFERLDKDCVKETFDICELGLSDDTTDIQAIEKGISNDIDCCTKTSNHVESDDVKELAVDINSFQISQYDAFSNEEIDAIIEYQKVTKSNLQSIDFELKILDNQRMQALKDFDIASAVRLGEQIAVLANESKVIEQSAKEYFNQIYTKECQFAENCLL